MAKEWCVMGGKPRYNGGNENEEFVYYAQDGFKEMLLTTFLSDPVLFCRGRFDGKSKTFETEVEIPAIVQQIQGDSELSNENAQVLAEIGTIRNYEYIKHRDEIWLITTEPHHNKIYEKSVIKLCKEDYLTFQDSDGNINYLPFWCQDTIKYSNGLKDNKVIIEMDKQYTIKLAYNEISSKLCEGNRFMLEMIGGIPSVYKLSNYDGASGNHKNIHTLNLALKADKYNSDTDNVEKWVCDYKEVAQTTPEVNVPTNILQYYCDITYKSEPILRVGSKKKLTASVYKMVKDDGNPLADENGYVRHEVALDKLNITWSLQGENSDKIEVIYASDKSYITIQTDEDSLIGGSVNVVLQVDGYDEGVSFDIIEDTQEIRIKNLYS